MSMIVILTANYGFSDLTPLTPGLPLAYAVSDQRWLQGGGHRTLGVAP
jgi:hypothetical protein